MIAATLDLDLFVHIARTGIAAMNFDEARQRIALALKARRGRKNEAERGHRGNDPMATKTPPRGRGAGRAQDVSAFEHDDAMLTITTVSTLTGMGKSTIRLHAKQGTFPAPVGLGPRAQRWRAGTIRAWLKAKAKADAKAEAKAAPEGAADDEGESEG